MSTSLSLNVDWDIYLDGNGNIVSIYDNSSLAQCVANAVRMFIGEYIYDIDLGIPYFENVLGYPVSELSYYKSLIEKEAIRIEGVISATVTFDTFENRLVTGNIDLITTFSSEVVRVRFGN